MSTFPNRPPCRPRLVYCMIEVILLFFKRGKSRVRLIAFTSYVYVDNLGVIGTNHGEIVEAMDALRQKFDGLGLELHGSEVSSGCVEALAKAGWSNDDKLREVPSAGLVRRLARGSTRKTSLCLVLEARAVVKGKVESTYDALWA